jgi:PAS domain S-box-containing protein
MFKKPDFAKKSEIITNLLIFAIAVVLASEIYTFMTHIMRTEHSISIIPFRIAVICVILVLAMLLRKTEISLLREYGAKKEQLYKTTIEDISEKLADEEMLLKEYKDAIDKSAIVSKTDKNGVIIYVNQRFCEVTGYSKEELIGKTHKLVRHPDNDREIFHTMWLKLLSKKTYHGKIKNIDKQGRTFFVEATITPILDSDNEISEFIAIMFDITKETLLKKSILEKTAKEQEESYKEELNRAKESFLLIFTHELKTPLNAIINFSSFVKKRIEKEDIEDKDRLLDLRARAGHRR